jgi:hypothetical protein
MGTIESGISAIKLLRKNDDIAMIGLGDETEAYKNTEITRLCQTDPNAVLGIGAIGNEVYTTQRADARVFDAKLLVIRKDALFKGGHERLGPDLELKPVIAFSNADNRPAVSQVRPE